MPEEKQRVAGPGAARRFTHEQVMEMRRLKASGLSNLKVARLMGTTHSTVQRLGKHGYGYVHPSAIRYAARKRDNRVRPEPSMTPWDEVAELWSRWHPSEAMTGKQAESLFHKVLAKIRQKFEKAGIVEPEDLELFPGSGGGTADAVDLGSAPEQG